MTKCILSNLFHNIFIVDFLKTELQTPKPNKTDHYYVP